MGGESSHFVNPNGLPADDQYSTARDMARVARAAYFNPLLREIMRTKHCMFRYATGKTISLQNTNRVLRTYSFCNGMKTGYTFAAGRCLISSASAGGREVILAQFGSKTRYIFDDAERMMRWGLSHGRFLNLSY